MRLKFKKLNQTEIIIYLLYILIPVIQIINSFILFESQESFFGKIFRCISIVLMIALIVDKIDKKQMVFLMIFITSFTLTAMVDVALGSKYSAFSWGVDIVKISSTVIYYITLVALYRKKKIREFVWKHIIDFYIWFMSLSFIIPKLYGIGHFNYEGTGYTSLYYENDACNILLCCLYLIALTNTFKKATVINMIKAVLIAAAMLMTGSKVSIVYMFVITAYAFFKYIYRGGWEKLILRTLVVIALIGVICLIADLFLDEWIQAKIDVYTSYYNWEIKGKNGTVMNWFTNGRTEKLEIYINKYYDKSDAIDVFFGIERKLTNVGLEMDFVDVYLKYGLFPLILLIYSWFYLYKEAGKVIGGEYDEYKFALLLIFIYSFMAGHVVESSFTCAAVALFASKLKINTMKFNDSDKEVT